MKNPFKKTIDEGLEQLETGAANAWILSGLKVVLAGIAIVALISLGLGFYWSQEPKMTIQEAGKINQSAPTGTATVQALQQLGGILLHKPGGYLSNDLLPPGRLLRQRPQLGVWRFGTSPGPRACASQHSEPESVPVSGRSRSRYCRKPILFR